MQIGFYCEAVTKKTTVFLSLSLAVTAIVHQPCIYQTRHGQFLSMDEFEILQGVMEQERAATVGCYIKELRRQHSLPPEYWDL